MNKVTKKMVAIAAVFSMMAALVLPFTSFAAGEERELVSEVNIALITPAVGTQIRAASDFKAYNKVEIASGSKAQLDGHWQTDANGNEYTEPYPYTVDGNTTYYGAFRLVAFDESAPLVKHRFDINQTKINLDGADVVSLSYGKDAETGEDDITCLIVNYKYGTEGEEVTEAAPATTTDTTTTTTPKTTTTKATTPKTADNMVLPIVGIAVIAVATGGVLFVRRRNR